MKGRRRPGRRLLFPRRRRFFPLHSSCLCGEIEYLLPLRELRRGAELAVVDSDVAPHKERRAGPLLTLRWNAACHNSIFRVARDWTPARRLAWLSSRAEEARQAAPPAAHSPAGPLPDQRPAHD